MTTLSQTALVLKQLKSGKALTAGVGRSLGVTRLSNRVFALRNQGHDIVSLPHTDSKGHAASKYVLASHMSRFVKKTTAKRTAKKTRTA